MHVTTQRLLLERVVGDWQSLAPGMQPWGMWIALYAPLPVDADTLDRTASRALRAWFLDARGLQPRGTLEYERFWIIHFEQPWCRRPYPEPGEILGAQTYPIGLAAFAAYSDTMDVYLQVEYGARFGRGYRVTVDGDQRRAERELWRS
jgi:hypothetical protein